MGVAPAIDLTAGQRRTVLALLNRHLPNTTVWAYGSRVKWTSHPASDLDLVAFAKPEQSPRVAELREAFDESNLPFRVDLFIWDDVPESFRESIEAEHVVLARQERDTCKEWPMVALGTVAINRDSRRVPLSRRQRELRRGSYPYYGATGIMDYVDDFLFEGPHVLVAEDGSVEQPDGRPFAQFVNGRFWVNNHAHVLTSETDQDIRYLYYAISATAIRSYISGSVQAKLSQGNLNRVLIPFPPTIERHAISSILSAFDDKIELNRRMAETLEGAAQVLYASYFAATPVAGDTKHRGVTSLGNLLDFNPPRSLARGQIAPYLDMANMPTRTHTPRSVARRPYSSSGTRFKNGDTLVARITPCLENGKTAYVDFLSEEEVGWGSTEFVVMRPKHPIPNEFAYCLAREPTFRQFAIQNMVGSSGRQRVSAKTLSEYPVRLPNEADCIRFSNHATPLMARSGVLNREAKALANLRDTLLPKLLSGEIRIRDAEKIAETAT